MGIMFTSLHKAVTFSAVAIAVSFGSAAQVIAGTLNGAGASFPAPLYQRYFAEYKKATGNTVNYNSVGSGAGVRQFIGETVDFGASDAPVTTAERQQMKRGVIMVPTAGGAVAVVYNLPGKKVNISRSKLPQIFSGELKTWDQVDAKLPKTPIRVVVRADGSGTTEIFTSHLSAVSPAFKSKVGSGKAPNWGFPVLKGPKNDGVAAAVKNTVGAIGYVQDTYARKNEGPNLQTAKVQNKAGQIVEPSLAEANKALGSATFDSNFVADVNDPPAGYPIVGMTWLLVYQNYKNAATANDMKALVKWILTTGQQYNTQLEYTKIPSNVAQRVIAAVNKIK
jgi:phosphate transport system substrate-binding protein